ncbi:tetratricopeptide repeat protein [Paeniglutamicibacter antarcticus]|uniref:Tetratricopeptide repeat protein n=1 Tax=Arthrobacter terrae TaxID=2935737 RepID=A0A931CUE2_9MICC|nr:tetratricopeptide repeat protein [Arthrobacter terrae]MBG0741589.1 tetratricopeptide repeat protein [Arthrobacter terrae]
MAYQDWPYAGFPGTAISPTTLLPEVVDAEACDQALSTTQDPADRIFVLLARGRVAEAAEAVADARVADPVSFRLQLLDADVLRATHHTERAVARLKCLAADIASTAMESWVHQQLGKVHFSAGNYPAAVRSFSTALDQRVAFGEDAAVIYASTVAVRRALDLAESSPA